jgi:chromosome segregation ATPase
MRREGTNASNHGTPLEGCGDLEHIQRQIDDRTRRLASLYDKLDEVSQQRTRIIEESNLSRGTEVYEDMRRRLEEIHPRTAAIAEEIERLVEELDDLFARLRSCQHSDSKLASGAGKSPQAAPSLEGDEQIKLQQRLGDIADAQNEVIREWNKNPAEGERSAFEAKLHRLHQEYNDILTQLNAMRAAKGKAASEG